MKRSYLWLFGLLMLSGCGRLETMLSSPLQTSESWLNSQPYIRVGIASREFILVQPSSTILVYALSILTIYIGLYFFRIKEMHKSRMWWGIALLFWGVGAFLAGTSYQAFSYEIKCVGYEYCLWTSWWEVFYMVFSVASVNAMMAALAYSSADGGIRKRMSIYAFANLGLYIVISIIGAFVPVKFLISFELMLVFLAPSVLFLFTLSLARYHKLKRASDRALVSTWLGLGLTIGAYYLYYLLGITETLWKQGIWFSENDVLHICLMIWMIFIAVRVGKNTIDITASV